MTLILIRNRFRFAIRFAIIILFICFHLFFTCSYHHLFAFRVLQHQTSNLHSLFAFYLLIAFFIASLSTAFFSLQHCIRWVDSELRRLMRLTLSSFSDHANSTLDSFWHHLKTRSKSINNIDRLFFFVTRNWHHVDQAQSHVSKEKRFYQESKIVETAKIDRHQ